jgi:AhpD family alkylhydroperoxidase
MAEFQIHDPRTAPVEARPILEQAKKSFGFVPNLYGVMAESPELLQGYLALSELFQRSSLSPEAKHVVWLAASAENGCHYCVAAHSGLALRSGLPQQVVDAIRSGAPIADPKLEAVRRFTEIVVATRGRPSPLDVAAFLASGYNRRHVLDVILGVGMKTLSNYTNHLAETPLDEVFRPLEWKAVG